MAELTAKERLQPSLLDRLTDDEPEKKVEERTKRVLSMQKLRSAVLRDLTWLLNTTHLQALQDLGAYPGVEQSVLNYGLPVLAGHTASSVALEEFEKALKQAILSFEPRILKNSLRIRSVLLEKEMSHNALSFEVEGDLWGQPVPEHLLLRTQVDLENGNVTVMEA